MHSALKSILKNIATLGFIGYIPFAPGTFGTLTGLILFMVFKPSLYSQLIIIVTGTITGICASSAAETIFNEKDSNKIVIDELIGYCFAVFCIPYTFSFIFAAFILFRFFDILKPLLISRLEKTLSGGLGIMTDDIVAGIYTNIILRTWILFFRN